MNLNKKMRREFVSIMIVMMVLGMNQNCECCIESEKKGLLEIKKSFNPHSFNFSSWSSSNADCCSWDGVYCSSNTRHVTEINLYGDMTTNVGSEEFWYMNASVFLPFQQLNQLSLDSNNIAGCIHNHGFEKLSSLSNLEILGLRSNKFNNSVLQTLSGFLSLTYLDLAFNKLDGTINITALANLTTTLQMLDLGWNQIDSFETMTVRFSRLETLDLSGNRFNSSILPFLRVLPSLAILDLSDNPLNETITNFFQIIGPMSTLEVLNLKRCGLSGKIPANSQGFCHLNNLIDLDVSHNDLVDNLPQCLANFTSLLHLDLSHNLFRIPISLSPLFNLSHLIFLVVDNSIMYVDDENDHSIPKFQLDELHMNGYGKGGALPKFLYHQHNLQRVYISDIQLRDEFPYWLLQNNTGLNTLYLNNISLSGPIQLPIHAHASLTTLDISNNFFNGSIPSQIGICFPSLTYLGMSKNDLKGSFPDTLCQTNPLSMLDISQNDISGTIPNCIRNMSQLEILDLSKNNISGYLPSNFSPPPLVVANLSKNRLKGTLHGAFYSCTHLVVLDLSHNNFSGSIPLGFGELSQLSFLLLGYNKFQGAIPVELCKLEQLSFLDLSHNTISSQMLPCLIITSSWSRQQFLTSIPNPLEITMKGQTYPYVTEILSYMSGIDVSCNNLTGLIPQRIGDLKNIKALNLSHNSFIGTIPETLSNLKEIESLDLSFNRLQGPIPPQLTQLTTLSSFNVSYNNLSGQTPNQVAQFATFDDNSSYIGNPLLCGWPLLKSCGSPNSPPSGTTNSPIDHERSDWLVGVENFFVSFGISYVMVLSTLAAVLCINIHWRRVWFYYVQMSSDKILYFINHIL